MRNVLDEALTLQTGAVSANGTVMVVALEDEKVEARVPHSHLLYWENNEWSTIANFDSLYVRVVWSDALRQWIALSETSEVTTISNGAIVDRQSLSPGRQPGQTGVMRGLSVVGDLILAAGMRRQVFLRSPTGLWTDIKGELTNLPAPGDVEGFESVHGFDENELYAVGWEGEIAVRHGGRWLLADSPTNRILTGVNCGFDDLVYACGQRGTIVRGRRESWELIETGLSEDLWEIVAYHGALYTSSLRSVFILESEGLRRVDMEEATTSSCYHLSVAGQYLCSVGALAIGLFDGEDWRSIPTP